MQEYAVRIPMFLQQIICITTQLHTYAYAYKYACALLHLQKYASAYFISVNTHNQNMHGQISNTLLLAFKSQTIWKPTIKKSGFIMIPVFKEPHCIQMQDLNQPQNYLKYDLHNPQHRMISKKRLVLIILITASLFLDPKPILDFTTI